MMYMRSFLIGVTAGEHAIVFGGSISSTYLTLPRSECGTHVIAVKDASAAVA